MPVYEYECKACLKTTEAIRRMADADALLRCDHCGSDKTARKHSVFATGGGERSTHASWGGSSGHVHSGSCGCGKAPGSCGMG